jgi:hypothetical protein
MTWSNIAPAESPLLPRHSQEAQGRCAQAPACDKGLLAGMSEMCSHSVHS